MHVCGYNHIEAG